MKVMSTLAVAALSLSSAVSFGATRQILGSTTIAAVISDAIIQAGLQDKLTYGGGGSGAGEAALVKKQQALAPMSRAFKADMVAAAAKDGVTVVEHVIALDGVNVFVNTANQSEKISFDDIRKIFSCAATDWSAIPASGLTGKINVLVRDDNSGTTDTFTSLAGVKFGKCVKVLAESDDIANATNTDANAVGYAGLSAKRDSNKALAVAKTAAGQAVLPTVANVRNFSYPLARKLYVYSAAGSFKPSADEQALLDKIMDRSFLDPIVQDHDFITLD